MRQTNRQLSAPHSNMTPAPMPSMSISVGTQPAVSAACPMQRSTPVRFGGLDWPNRHFPPDAAGLPLSPAVRINPLSKPALSASQMTALVRSLALLQVTANKPSDDGLADDSRQVAGFLVWLSVFPLGKVCRVVTSDAQRHVTMPGAEVEPFAVGQRSFYLYRSCRTGHLCLPAFGLQGGDDLEPRCYVLLVLPPSLSLIHVVMVLDLPQPPPRVVSSPRLSGWQGVRPWRVDVVPRRKAWRSVQA